MKKIFDSAYGKDLAAFLLVLAISLELHSWDLTNLIFLVGPLVAFIPRVTYIYYAQKSPKEGEKAMIAAMAVGYLFLAIGFAGESAAVLGKDVLTTLFTAAFYYLMLWSFTSYGFLGQKEVVKQPKYILAVVVVAIAYLLYEMFNTKTFSQQWYQYAVIVLIGLVGITRQIVLHKRAMF